MLRTAVFAIATLFCAASALAQGIDGRLKKIADTKTINVAYRIDATPFSFVDDSKQTVGFTVDLCKRIVNSIERQLNITGLKVNWVPVTVQTRFEAITKGQADMECGSSTVTLSRFKTVDFSSYIFVESTGVLVMADSNIRSLSDMSGKKIAVIGGTTNERAVNEQIKRRQLNTTVIKVKNGDEALAMLEGGKADAYASDKMLLVGTATRAKDPKKLALLPDELSFEPYAITLPRNEAALRLAVNTGLAQLYSSGEVSEIFNRWFGGLGSPSMLVRAVYVFGSIPD